MKIDPKDYKYTIPAKEITPADVYPAEALERDIRVPRGQRLKFRLPVTGDAFLENTRMSLMLCCDGMEVLEPRFVFEPISEWETQPDLVFRVSGPKRRIQYGEWFIRVDGKPAHNNGCGTSSEYYPLELTKRDRKDDEAQARSDTQRLDWWFGTHEEFDVGEYLRGVREKWTPAKWREWIDSQMDAAGGDA